MRDPNLKIRFLQGNPKQTGSKSNARYEIYKAATTAQEMLALGGKLKDLAYDLSRNFCSVCPGPRISSDLLLTAGDMWANPLGSWASYLAASEGAGGGNLSLTIERGMYT